MSDNSNDRRATARRKAQNYFSASEQRDEQLRREIETERAKSAAKTARLRALRLAKEAADKEAASKEPEAQATTKRTRTPRMKRAPGN